MNAGKQNKCPDCDRVFDKPQQLGAHRARAHGYRRDAQTPVVTSEGEQTERINPDEHPGVLIADPVKYPQYQRPLDEDKLEEHAESFEPADRPRDLGALMNSIDAQLRMEFTEATATYLPFLAREVRRSGDADLVTALVTLFLDVS